MEATRVGGFAGIGKGIPGVRLVPPGDPVILAAEVDRMTREHLGHSHPDEMVRTYSLERVVGRTEDVYAQILMKMNP